MSLRCVFGFLLGSLTILASALITGGVGPWMPYQMLTAGGGGHVGGAGACARVPCGAVALQVRAPRSRAAAFGIFWGFAYGTITNIWFRPFAMGPSSMYWQPGIGVWETLQRYAVFYAWPHCWRGMWWRRWATRCLIVLLGSAVLRILRRFHRRFDFAYIAAPLYEAQPAHSPPAHAPRGQGALAPAPMRSRV